MRIRSLTAFLILTICSLYESPFAPADTATTDYFPLAVGNRWVYESSEGTEASPALETWEVIRREGAAFVVRIQQPFVTLGGLEEYYEVGAKGVERRVPDSNSSEPQLILQSPPAAGASWQTAEARYAVTSVGEPVTVPAGTFPNCVEVTRWNKGTKVIVVSTYAPGVGIIQREETFPVIGGFGGDFETAARGRTVLRLKTWKVKDQKARE